MSIRLLPLLEDGFDGFRGCLGAILLVLLVGGCAALVVIGKVSADHDQVLLNESIPKVYVGNWSGRTNGKPGVSPDGAPPVDGPISVEIPSGMTVNTGAAEVAGPGSQCAEEWTVTNISAHSVSFDTGLTKGSDNICGDVDIGESDVIVTNQGQNRLSVKWVDYGYTVGQAVLHRD
jgi:hypothetical protein